MIFFSERVVKVWTSLPPSIVNFYRETLTLARYMLSSCVHPPVRLSVWHTPVLYKNR